MKKGFTLIELLGVIVILSLIMLVVFPNVLSVIKKSNQDKDTYTLTLIKNAADIYIKEHPDVVDEKFCRVISDDKVQPHFHISVQSGSSKILAAMNRPYAI